MFDKAEEEFKDLAQKKKTVENDKAKIEKVLFTNFHCKILQTAGGCIPAKLHPVQYALAIERTHSWDLSMLIMIGSLQMGINFEAGPNLCSNYCLDNRRFAPGIGPTRGGISPGRLNGLFFRLP